MRELPEEKQDSAAEFHMDYVTAVEQDVTLTHEQLAEVRRRRAEKKPKMITLKQLDARLRRLGA